MKIIIPGASGFIGRNFLLASPKNWQIAAIYHRSKNFANFLKENKLFNVKSYQCDLTQENQVKNLARKIGQNFDACLYLAANSDPALSTTDPTFDLRATVLTLVNFGQYFKIKKFIYLSSGAVYDRLKGPVSPKSKLDPHLPYAITHFAAEQYTKYFTKIGNFKSYIIIRFFGAYGPYEPERKIYTKLIRRFAFEDNDIFQIRGNGKNYIDAMYIDDAVKGLLKVIQSNQANTTFDFCRQYKMTVNDLVKKAANVFGKKAKITHYGQVSEYIEFYGSPTKFNRTFHFNAKVELEEGLTKLAKFLTAEKGKK